MKKLTNEQFLKKVIKIHGYYYDYSLVEYINSRTKIKIICPIHGVFEQTPNSHMRGQGCLFCYLENKKMLLQDFIKKSIEIHGNKYDYSLVEYKGANIKVKIICPVHGIFLQTPSSHLQNRGCKKCGIKNNTYTRDEIIDIFNNLHKNFYDYSLVEYFGCFIKIKIICPIHGIFEQSPNNHLNGCGCKKCKDDMKKINKKIFSEKSNKIHRNFYDYSLVDYKNNYTKVEIICPIHGVFKQKPNSHMNGQGCPSCKETKGEKYIKNYLIENNIYFIKQYRFNDCRNIYPLPFDFYLPEYNMCIEYDGEQHFKSVKQFGGDEGLKETIKRDKIKTDYCLENNINLIRIVYNISIHKQLIYKF